MSVAHIGKLEENTATLCKNGCKTLRVSAIGIVQNGCETLWVSAISKSGYVYPEKLKRPPFPSGVRHRM